MRLVSLSLASIVGCCLALLLLAGFGFWSVQQIETKRAEVTALIELKSRADALSVASDNLLLFTPDEGLWAAYVADARAIRSRLLELGEDRPPARRAARQIEQLIASLQAIHAGEMTLQEADSAAGVGPLTVPRRARIVMAQVAGHGITVDRALEQLLAERQQQVRQETGRALIGLAAAAVGFGGMCVFAFAYMYRRLVTPTRALARTIDAVSDGDFDARTRISGRDELSELGEAFNRLLDEQQEALGIIRDQRDALSRQGELLRMGGEVARFGGWSADLENNVVYWSDMVAEIHGMPRGYAPRIDEGIRFYAPEHRQRITALFTRCVEHGEAYDDELQIIRADGERRWVRSSGAAFRDSTGRIRLVQGAFQDITDRVSLESQLRQSQRLEAIGQLTGGISHDFNNILTVILGNADLLAEELADAPGQRALAERIAQSAQRGAELTHQLLAFARRQPLDPVALDINGFVTGMHELLQRTLGAPIRVSLDLTDDLWPAMVDPGQLESAVLNLALNARDAMPGGGQLVIRTRNAALDGQDAATRVDVEPGDYVRLSVSDTGAGIAAEHLDRLFEPFFTTKGEGKGTGLGLPMVYGFIKQSRGHITVDSAAGEGTTITLYFPRAVGSVAAPGNADVGWQDPPARGDETILMVEDDAMVQAFVRTQLEQLGYRVLGASNAGEALATLQTDTPVDLLFTDIVMPGGMDGAELADAATALRPALPVLFTSGYTDKPSIRDGQPGMRSQLLCKPYRSAELARRLRQLLD